MSGHAWLPRFVFGVLSDGSAELHVKSSLSIPGHVEGFSLGIEHYSHRSILVLLKFAIKVSDS